MKKTKVRERIVVPVYANCEDCMDCLPHKHSFGISPEDKLSECKCCGGDIKIRNPKGYCDHLYYPENCNGKCTPKLSEKECGCYCHNDKGSCGCPDWNRCCDNGNFGEAHKCQKQSSSPTSKQNSWEEELNKKFRDTKWYPIYWDDIESFIRKLLSSQLNSLLDDVLEKVVGEDEGFLTEAVRGDYEALNLRIERRNDLRSQQRVKIAELRRKIE